MKILRWSLFLPALLLVASESAQANSVESRTSDADVIRKARIEQNAMLSSGDLENAALLWTDDITCRRGLGASISGKEEYLDVFDTGDSPLIYVREPALIEVSPDWPLAYEQGSWTMRRGNIEGPVVISGNYAAQWVKRGDCWLIRSELFVALTCSEESGSWQVLP